MTRKSKKLPSATALLCTVEYDRPKTFVEGVDLRENPLYGLESPRAFLTADGSGGAVLGMGLHHSTPVIGYLCTDSGPTLRTLLAHVAAPGLIADTEAYSPTFSELGYPRSIRPGCYERTVPHNSSRGVSGVES